MVSESVLRLGRNQVLGAILVVAVGLRLGFAPAVTTSDPDPLLRFFLYVTFAGFILDIISRAIPETLLFSVAGVGFLGTRAEFDAKTEDLLRVVKQDPTIGSFVSKSPRHVWKVAGRFLSQTREMGFSPTDDLERCASFALVGWIGGILGALFLGWDVRLSSSFITLDSGLLAVGILLLFGARAARTDFVEGTLAGMTERLRALREAETNRRREPTIGAEEIGRLENELSGIITRRGDSEGVRITDAIFANQLFQESKNVDALAVPSLRKQCTQALGAMLEDSSETVQLNCLYTLASILRMTVNVEVYTEVEADLHRALADAAPSFLKGDSASPLGSAYAQVLYYCKDSAIVAQLMTVLSDARTGSSIMSVILDVLGNSFLADSNRDQVLNGLRELARKRADFANYTASPLNNLERRRNAAPEARDRIPRAMMIVSPSLPINLKGSSI